MNTAAFAEWIGRTSEAKDLVTERLDRSFRAIFDPHLAPVAEGEAPLGLHWCLSPSISPMEALGGDGHPALSLDLPPVPQPRRMWAGGWLKLHSPLRVGDQVQRSSTITAITSKQGRSGELWFVTVRHTHRTPRGVAVEEQQDIVYREPARSSPAQAREARPEPRPARVFAIEPSPVLLFRYSAITFNGHRIHYDLPYATQVEGYAGLVVHGPVQATLLLNMAAAGAGAPPARFEYRALSPALAGVPLTVCAGADGTFWTQGPTGGRHMEARVTEARSAKEEHE